MILPALALALAFQTPAQAPVQTPAPAPVPAASKAAPQTPAPAKAPAQTPAPTPAKAPVQAQAPDSEDTIPSSAHPLQTVSGRGVQIYACTKGVWVFQAPEATLVDIQTGSAVGTHSDGPTWTWQDGSSVKGEVVQKVPSSDADSIPWLLLRAKPAPQRGAMDSVVWVRRSDTRGGAAPATGCDATHEGSTTRVRYTATYTFYTEP